MYVRFFTMLTVSFIIMYSVMYLNVDSFDHVYLSNTRFYMTLLMVCPMAIVMLLVMRNMYENKIANISIIITNIILFIIALFFLRNQVFIEDVQYMKAMIPHHSSAILTSQEAVILDPEVKKLAEEIIRTQEEEIALMKELLGKMDDR
jgi:hypothetical protein